MTVSAATVSPPCAIVHVDGMHSYLNVIGDSGTRSLVGRPEIKIMLGCHCFVFCRRMHRSTNSSYEPTIHHDFGAALLTLLCELSSAAMYPKPSLLMQAIHPVQASSCQRPSGQSPSPGPDAGERYIVRLREWSSKVSGDAIERERSCLKAIATISNLSRCAHRQDLVLPVEPKPCIRIASGSRPPPPPVGGNRRRQPTRFSSHPTFV